MGGYWVCDGCKSLNDPRFGACYKCHAKRGQAKPQPIIPGATTGPAASEVFGTGGRIKGEPSVRLAVLFGTIAALLATAGWYWLEAGIYFGRGRLAWLVGVTVAAIVVLAGTVGGRRRVSFVLPVISFMLTFGAVLAGEYLIISAALATAAGIDPGGSIPIAQPSDVVRVVGDYLTTDPLRPLLWALALGAAWLIPWGMLVGSDAPDPERRDWVRRN